MNRNISLLSFLAIALISISFLTVMPQHVEAQEEGRPYAERAASHLGTYLGRTISLDVYPWTWRENLWNTPAMGCPDPNQTYPQTSTRGYEIKINVDAVEYLYYVSSDRTRVILCINNLPDPSSILPTPPPPQATGEPTLVPTATLPATMTPTPTVIPGYPQIMTDPNWEPQTIVIEDVNMVLAPIGCFMMGSVDGDEDELPIHEVCFREPFWLDQTEVTRTMYAECLAGGVCTETLESDYSFRPEQPINRLSWFQARDYCEWRGARLPTEAEWEYAARGPQGFVYPWGNEFNENHVVFATNSQNLTADVGSLPDGASWLGAVDMSGNVWEWTSTIYLYRDFPYPYDARDGREDPEDSELSRVIRGGSLFVDDAQELRGSYRNLFDPNDGSDGSIGVRCARDFKPADLSLMVGAIQNCNEAVPSRLKPGNFGVVDDQGDTNSLNIRNLPTASGSEIVGQIPILTEFQVLAGPVCDDENNAWYRIHIVSDGQEGWVIEAIGSDYTIRPRTESTQSVAPTPTPMATVTSKPTDVSATIDDCLVSNWKTGNGSNFIDIVGNNDGVVHGAEWRQADYYHFDGNDYIQVADNPVLDFGNGDFSINVWIRTSNSNLQVIIDDRYEFEQVIGYTLFMTDDGVSFQLADGSHTNYAHTDPVNDGKWHMITATIDRDDPKGGHLYVDGKLEAQFNPTGHTGSLDNNMALRIGSRSSSNSALFRGDIRNVALWNCLLTAEKISELYTQVSSLSDAPSCNPIAPSRLRPADYGYIDDVGDTADLNLRDLPTLTGSTVITHYPILTVFQVLEGPVCDDENNAWYRIHIVSDGQEGWVIEAIGSDYTIRPQP